MRNWSHEVVLTTCLVSLAACTAGKGAKEAEAYSMIEKSELSTRDEKCAQATRARDAYLSEGNQKEYEYWQLIARVDCSYG